MLVSQFIQQIDHKIYSFFASYQNPHWLDINQAISFLGSTPVLLTVIGLTGFFLLLKKWTYGGISFLIFFSLGLQINSWLKLVFERLRPIPFVTDEILKSFAFPSGHAFGAITVYLTLAWILVNARQTTKIPYTLATILILAIGLSRIALGVHWASDVVGGYLIGLIYFFIYMTGAKKLNFFARKP